VNLLTFFIFLLVSLSAAAQPQVVNFKQLQQSLPQGDIQNYTRGRTYGETSTMMGFVTSWAQVTYLSSADSNSGTISVKITDMLNISSYMSIPLSPQGNSNPSTVSGYKNTVSHNNMNVLETYDSTSRQAKLQLTLATRFLIEINGSGVTSPGVLYLFLDRVDVDSLEKIAQTAAGSQGR
jgi:hypothetical protein